MHGKETCRPPQPLQCCQLGTLHVQAVAVLRYARAAQHWLTVHFRLAWQ